METRMGTSPSIGKEENKVLRATHKPLSDAPPPSQVPSRMPSRNSSSAKQKQQNDRTSTRPTRHGLEKRRQRVFTACTAPSIQARRDKRAGPGGLSARFVSSTLIEWPMGTLHTHVRSPRCPVPSQHHHS